jgi:hypothetical protein
VCIPHRDPSYSKNVATRKKTFSASKEVKAIARERVGTVPASRPIEPKSARKKPKYKQPIGQEGEAQ